MGLPPQTPFAGAVIFNRSASASAPCCVRSTPFDGRRLPRPPKAPKFPLVRFFFFKTHCSRFCGRGIRKGAFGGRMSSPATTLDVEDEQKLTRSPLKILSLKKATGLPRQIQPRSFRTWHTTADLPPQDQQPGFSRNKTGCTKSGATCFIAPRWLRSFWRQAEKQQRNSIVIVFPLGGCAARLNSKLASGCAYSSDTG